MVLGDILVGVLRAGLRFFKSFMSCLMANCISALMMKIVLASRCQNDLQRELNKGFWALSKFCNKKMLNEARPRRESNKRPWGTRMF
jgi:hypothetical protein